MKDQQSFRLREGRSRPPAVPRRSRSIRTPARPATSSTRRPRPSSGPPTRRTWTCGWSTGWTRPTRSSTSPSATAGGICISWTPPKGEIRNQITKGEWVVRGIDRIDEDARQIWFHACGKNADQDPYFVHYYRVNFDGSGLVALTEGNGKHSIQYSPDRRYLIDTYSRVDMAPVHELRRVSDGKLVCPLEKADISELTASGWTAPEVFVAKGRDGKTDIWGIICRPKDFDPSKKYPVIEYIYAGPQGSYVPKTLQPVRRQFASLTDLGFIVVQMDGMGTANRSKAFHDVCWKNLKDAGFPDRILWHQAAAKKYPYYDISRVGVYGNSAGGQNAAAAVLFHPEFYKAAVASCGCHDNRMDKASWNEQWMGYPVGPCYAECSNIDNAARLRGKLFLIVGEMDDNVPPESTMRFVGRPDQGGQGFRPARRPRRRPRHGRRLRPAPHAGFLRPQPARHRTAESKRHLIDEPRHILPRKNSMNARRFVPAILPLFLVVSLQAGTATITIDAGQKGPVINPRMYGIFLEEINHGVDGGLYAELIRNRGFEDSRPPEGFTQRDGRWLDAKGYDAGFDQFGYTTEGDSLLVARSNRATRKAACLSKPPAASPNNPRHCLRLDIEDLADGRLGVANEGFFGIGVKQGEKYDLSLYARGGNDFTGPLSVIS